MGQTHAHLRLGLERDHEAWVFGQGRALFNIENWYSLHALMRTAFRVSGFYARGQRNAARVVVKENTITSQRLPSHFDGFTILQLSDLHVETSAEALASAASAIDTLDYDICVLTGDFRSLTYGPHEAAMEGLEKLLRHVQKPTYAVLGNHDTILMVPELERMGVRVLLNEADAIPRGTSGEPIFIAGVDDAHYFRADNLEKASSVIPAASFSVLLSHTPELYRQAANAEFDVMLSGHTHGGQVCLPGGVALKFNAVIPRRLGAGAWQHNGLQGYTSRGLGTCIAAVRFNCPPEITLHRLRPRRGTLVRAIPQT